MSVLKKDAKIEGWSRRYRAALRKHLKQSSHASLLPALRLGRRAVALGLETLDLARTHKQALLSVVSPDGSAKSRTDMIERAQSFFTEAIVPIEKTHHAALEDDVRVNQLKQTLQKLVVESSASTRHLERGVTRRQAAEAALKKSGKQRSSLLQESSRLQTRLRYQMREILLAQENERQEMSRQLHDEIAQTLLGINVWLLTLKSLDKAKTETFNIEIANTQRLVKQFIKRVNQFAHEFIISH